MIDAVIGKLKLLFQEIVSDFRIINPPFQIYIECAMETTIYLPFSLCKKCLDLNYFSNFCFGVIPLFLYFVMIRYVFIVK